MKVVRAEHAGVCYGVERALDMVRDAMDGDEDVFTIGPLIHNPRVVAQLKDHGVESIEGPADVDHGIVVLRTHGVEPSVVEELDERGLSSIDATCPHVSRAQKAAADFAAQGMTVLVIGRASHPEVRGICAHAAGSAVVVADASEIPADIAGPVGIVVQTTENKSKLDKVVADLRGRGIEPVVKNTICSATRKRQDAAADLADKVDALVVIGGKNSSNTTHLFEICRAHCSRSYHIETEDEIDPAWFDGVEAVGVTAGASTPDEQIEAVVARIESL
ncbi:4-hydroxy-3-methylbut-2-enyl diphosphate reductase [Slackia exigua]|uniref:4-hydroxy-3-methylbut-2-enyl diphosphate reductase n=1 Tax=Slackia exigua TaxID=84109 RepID=UPI00254C51B3|nr:4-hydroxy-3-methylbut-2-enyl diphosphate reductase [Slackia exigua]MDK7723606.1 4-hydroxy-3-methylbut-2-enyl diphosphate reductase [Slackia exigua]MDK7725772.1 4-hydroxy-3-methylbut-2-enyl diphosphate reductase [Slackia exigua]